ncbi:hypothetical protein [Desulfoplanes sp.]
MQQKIPQDLVGVIGSTRVCSGNRLKDNVAKEVLAKLLREKGNTWVRKNRAEVRKTIDSLTAIL